jgi:hypothetical protein
MPEYIVRWWIEVEADSPAEAAITAANMVKDPEGVATLFDVLDPTDESLIEQIDVAKEAQ